MHQYLQYEWIADREHPENFKKVEEIIIKYTVNILDTSGFTSINSDQ